MKNPREKLNTPWGLLITNLYPAVTLKKVIEYLASLYFHAEI